MRKSALFNALILPVIVLSGARTAESAIIVATTYPQEGLFVSGREAMLGSSDLSDVGPGAILLNPAPAAFADGAGSGYGHADFLGGSELSAIGAYAAWNGWRLGIARSELDTGQQIVRTAYEPEGTGEHFRIRERMTVLGLSRSHAWTVDPFTTVGFAVGAAYRRYSQVITDAEPGAFSEQDPAGALDVGGSLQWHRRFPGGWSRVTTALSVQNALGTDTENAGRKVILPKPLRTGVTVAAGFGPGGEARNHFRFQVSAVRTFEVGPTYRDNSSQVGFETVVMDFLALRYGASNHTPGDISSWGAGLILDHGLLGRFTVEADLGGMRYGDFDGDRTIWGLLARYAY